LRKNFRSIDPATTRILLVEGADRLLPPFPETLSHKAERALRKMRVEIWTSARVLDIFSDHVKVERNGVAERIDTATTIWAAGVRPSPLGKFIAEATGAQLDRAGRVIVQKDLSVGGHPNIFVIGDLAAATYPDGKPLPGVAPVAMQQGRYVAQLIRMRAEGKSAPGPFRYWDKGNVATIGRNAAVIDLYWLRLSGRLAWFGWLFIHIMYLIQFESRLLVMMQWFWNYLTRNRSARLITGPDSGFH
jgi:NADH dehydrogenase